MLTNFRSMFFFIFAFVGMATGAPVVSAAETSLADYKYVLHISDMDPSKQELILNNASNLLDAYPPGAVEIEIVAYGPGLRLMLDRKSTRLNSSH